MTRAISWILTLLLAIGGGVLIQWAAFKTPTNSFPEALRTWPGLWIVYVLVALSLGERIHRSLTRK